MAKDKGQTTLEGVAGANDGDDEDMRALTPPEQRKRAVRLISRHLDALDPDSRERVLSIVNNLYGKERS